MYDPTERVPGVREDTNRSQGLLDHVPGLAGLVQERQRWVLEPRRNGELATRVPEDTMDLSLQGRPSCSDQLDRQVAAATRRFPAVRSGEELLERRASTPSTPTARSERAPQQVAPWVIRAA